MTTIPVRVFGITAPAFRAGPGGHVLKVASTGAQPASNTTTTMGFGTGTGSRQVIPLTANTTVASAGASATNKGWRDESYTHVNQSTQVCRLSGTWVFTYALSGGVLASTVQMTVVVYAVTAANVTRELFRNTSGNFSVSVTATGPFVQTFTPADVDLVADEILQYEFFLNCSVNGNTIAGTTITFTCGTAGSGIGTASTTNTMFAVFARGYVGETAAFADGAIQRLYGAMRTQSENALAVDSVARQVTAQRALSENALAIDTVDRMYGSFRSP